MTKKIFYFSIIILCFSCAKKEKLKNEIEISLTTKSINNPTRTYIKPFIFLDSASTDEFKGFNASDSAYVGYISTFKIKEIDQSKKDSIYKNLNKIFILSQYRKGKQFFTLDANSNKDFSDDKEVEIDSVFKNRFNFLNAKHKDSFSTLDININKLLKGKVYEDKETISIHSGEGYYNYKDKEPSLKEKLKRKLLLLAMFKSYFYGTFSIDDKEYKVAINKNDYDDLRLLFSESGKDFYAYNDSRREVYRISDTLEISENHYRIDKMSFQPPILSLEKVNLLDNVIGFRKGNIIKDYKVENLDSTFSNFTDLFTDKELLLIDFWGTWCGPCKELTPDLVSLNNKYGHKVSLVSLAYEKKVEPVKKYADRNNMTWFNGIIRGIPKSAKEKHKMIADLRVNSFPTFILLDKDLKIIYRGVGDKIEEVEKIIEKY